MSTVLKVAIILIGDELLSGRVRDTNGPYLCHQLHQHGMEVTELRMVGDCEEQILETFRQVNPQVDLLFCSGGIGPTHDDNTLSALARFHQVPLVESPKLKEMLCKIYDQEVLLPSQQKMALIPQGSSLLYHSPEHFPQLKIGKIYPLPGVPHYLRQRVEALLPLYPRKERFSKLLTFQVIEERIASFLTELAQKFPQVKIGCYPHLKEGIWETQVHLESFELSQLQAACQELIEQGTPIDEQ